MSKVKKIVVVLFCLILAIIPCFSVSAQEITSGNTTITCTDSDMTFEVTDVSYIVTRSGHSYDGGTLSITNQDNGIQFRFNLNSDVGTLKDGDLIDVVISLSPKSNALKDSSLNVDGKFRVGINSKAGFVQPGGMVGYRFESSSGYSQNASCEMWSSDFGDYCLYSFNENSIGCTFDEYTLGFSYVVDDSNNMLNTYCRYVYLADIRFKTFTKEEIASQQIIDNQNENTDKIIQNQDENTQAIIDNEKELQEQEKQEANDTGDDGVNQIGSVIPNDSDGFIDSIGNLVGAMSYTGTDCNWELPSVSLPKIDGVMPSIKLWDKQEIPFEYWIAKIPSGTMTLVQSLLTIALIVYCFKELYSVISYVLTLKGGGANE